MIKLIRPSFWKSRNFISYGLYPLSMFYYSYIKIRSHFIKTIKTPIAIICIGNVIAGGSGKTPVSIEIANILQHAGIRVAFLTRGYLGKIKKFTTVSEMKHTAKDVGEEALLLSKTAATFVAIDRVAAARRIAKTKHFDLIIMDDGLQNNSIHKDISLLVTDSNFGFGNGFMLPAGPLREPVSEALAKVHAVINIGDSMVADLPNFQASIVATNIPKVDSNRVVAFAAIGDPSKFYDTLEHSGYNICYKKDFPDHYFYNKKDLSRLFLLAQKYDATLMTTEKDWLRLHKRYRDKILYLPIKISFDKESEFSKFIIGLVKRYV